MRCGSQLDRYSLVFLDEPALIHEEGSAAQKCQRILIVCRDHNSRSVAVNFLEKFDDFKARVRIEVTGGLIGQQKRRAIDQGARDTHTLSLARRKDTRRGMLVLLETDQLDELLSANPRLSVGQTPDLCRESDIFNDRKSVNQSRILENQPQLTPKTGQRRCVEAVEVASIDDRATAGQFLLREEDAHQSRLARARWPGHENELTGRDVEAQIAKRDAA